MKSLPFPYSSRKSGGRGFFGPSWEIFRVSGIPIRLHWSFALVLAWAAFVNYVSTASISAVFAGIFFVVTVFFCVVLHELGHALTAKYFGIPTRSITLSPLGGVAALEKNPRHWKDELWITAAGPAVNAVIALLLLPFVFFLVDSSILTQSPLLSPASFIFLLFVANVMLVLFNLVPAFPMDGGRIFRSILTPFQGKLRATRIASRTGQVFAVGMAILGLFASPFLLIIAAFVFLAAAAERKNVEMESALSGATVSDAMRHSFDTASHSHTVDEGIEMALRTGQNTLPVMYDGRLLGLAHLSDLIAARHQGQGHNPLHQFINKAPAYVRPSDELMTVFHAMQAGNREIVPVLNGERLVGLLPQRSVVSLLQLRAA